MSEDDPRHGTPAGYRAGCHNDCCRSAKRRYEKRRRYLTNRGTKFLIDPTGTRRRIQALAAIGWRFSDIDAHLGRKRSVYVILDSKKVSPRTAQRVAAVYEQLCMTPGPSRVAAKRAQEKGWAPPLAWDDIDTDPAPVEWRSQRRRRPSSELVEDVADLLAAGEHASVIAARLGVTVATLARNLARTAPHLAPPFEKERKRSAA